MKLWGPILFFSFWIIISIDAHVSQKERKDAGYDPIKVGSELAKKEALQDAEIALQEAKLQEQLARDRYRN